jgi:hypothetical protein
MPGFGAAFSASVALVLSGCGGAAFKATEAMSAPAMPAPPAPAPEMAAAPAADAARPAREEGMAGIPGVTSSTADSVPSAPLAAQPGREMLDIEGNVSLQVPKVKSALRALHELTARAGGVITQERIDTSSTYGTAQVTLRVPSGKAQNVLEQLEGIGNVLGQSIEAKDIGKEYFDANVRLASLQLTLQRYEEILTRATKVEEILRIEQELGRLRTEIEQVKGNLRWLSDRAARATLHLTLREHAPKIVETYEPEAKFFPGLRLPALIDFGKHGRQGYVGGGLSVRFSRALSLDLDLFKQPGSDARGPDAVLATIGGETYSSLLGDGERAFLNPYLGIRAGYGRFDRDNQALVGVTLGLELFKNRWFGLDVEARNYLAFFGDRGAHYVASPALAARVAF